MKFIHLFLIAIAVIFNSNSSHAQSYQYGIEISPSFDFQVQRANNSAWQAVKGNGFLIGGFFDKNINEHTFISSGLKFEYVAFNNKSGDFLVSSFRMASLNIPVLFKQEIGVTEHWFYNAGLGVNYNFLNRQFFSGNWFNINEAINQIQPYVNIGLHYRIDSRFEVGTHARYHFINIFKEDLLSSIVNTSKLFSIDFSLRYAIASH